jgi:hypothetical protein
VTRHAIDTRCGPRADRPIRRPETIDVNVMQERGEPHIPVLPRHPAHAIQPAWRALPAPSPERVALATFPSGDPLPSTTSATPTGALFGSFAGTTGPSDFPRSCITGLRPRPFPHDPPNHHHKRVTVGPPGSRARRFRICTGSSTSRGPPTARENAADDIAFRTVGQRRHPNKEISRLNNPACTYPYRRFAAALADGQRTARGHRGSLTLRCWTLSFLSPDRFIPALPTQILGHSPVALVGAARAMRRARARRGSGSSSYTTTEIPSLPRSMSSKSDLCISYFLRKK